MRALLAMRLFLLGMSLAAAAAHAVTLSVSPSSMGPGGPITATWSGIASPTGSDWIGLYAAGAANTSYISQKRFTNGAANGSIPINLPNPQAYGTYELRLFSNNTFSLLATSNSLFIGPSVSGTITLNGSPLANVPLGGATNGICFPTNASGQYACAVPLHYSGTLTPALPGYLFTPTSRSYSSLTVNQTAQHFTAASAPQVTGVISLGGSPLAGVALSGSNGASCTSSNASGQYSCTVPTGWSGSVTPALAGHIFEPASRSYASVGANYPGQAYAATVAHQVSGAVTVGGSPLGAVELTASDGGTCTASNVSGQYTCTVPQGWSGTITPSLIHNSFSPASRSYTNVTSAQAAQDYAGTVIYQVSGSVTLNGVPLADVSLAATNGVTCSSSNASGQYNCTVPPGWSGTVTPSATGYSFSPASRNFSGLVDDQTAQSFAATLDTATAPLYFVHVDHLNSPREIYDASSQLRWRWDQAEPFGVNVADENPSSLGAFEFALRFPGQYFDRETNLHYNYFRDYDPLLGRYEQSDPIGLQGGINTYVYAFNPLTQIDPAGLMGYGGGGASGGTPRAPGNVKSPLPSTTPTSPSGGSSSCNGQWIRYGTPDPMLPRILRLCTCYWICQDCQVSSNVWSGSKYDLPSTVNQLMFDPSRVPSSNDGDAESGNYCLCIRKPGPETGCSCKK